MKVPGAALRVSLAALPAHLEARKAGFISYGALEEKKKKEIRTSVSLPAS